MSQMNSQLDAHGEALLKQFQERLPLYNKVEEIAFNLLSTVLDEQGFYVTAIEHRVKTVKSLIGKLELKGAKYHSIDDITDLVGLRIITFYTDDVDKVAALVKHSLEVDWKESVDKRKMHQTNSFGYNSLHYICSIPQSIIDDPAINSIRFELQMRTALQHVWSTIEHDIGYKGEVQLPGEYRRQFSRLAGMLELVDNEFSRLRNTVTDYRWQVKSLVKSGQLTDVPLNNESFRNFLELHPFNKLNQRIAAVNQAEIIPTPLLPFLPVLEHLGMETLGDVERFINDNEEDAYQLAISQLALTDLDIIAENIGLQNLCVVHILKNGGGRMGLKAMYDILFDEQENNMTLADNMMRQATGLAFMQPSN